MAEFSSKDRNIIATAAGSGAGFLVGFLSGAGAPLALYGRPLAAVLLGALAYGGRVGALRLLAAWFGLPAVATLGGVFSGSGSTLGLMLGIVTALLLGTWAFVLWRIRPTPAAAVDDGSSAGQSTAGNNA